MNEFPYVVSGATIPVMLGRDQEVERFRRIVGENHISVVGPKHMGKTVLLNAIGKRLAVNAEKPFVAYMFWDVRHNTPANDNEFFVQFAERLAAALKDVESEYASIVRESDKKQEALTIILTELRDNGQQVLVVMDGLDDLLLSGGVSKNLWDALRTLGELPSIRYVTGSRRRLRELCASPEARSSDFWRLFTEPFELGPLRERDMDSYLLPLTQRGLSLEKGADTELKNWAGGLPIVLSAICATIYRESPEGASLGVTHVRTLAEQTYETQHDLLTDLWNDIPEDERGIVTDIASGKEVSAADVPRQQLKGLRSRGLLNESGRTLALASRMVEKYANEFGQNSARLALLFGSSKDYEDNIPGLVRLRLSQLPASANNMTEFLETALLKFDKPEIVIAQVRGIEGKAVSLIWQKFCPNGIINPQWVGSWKFDGVRADFVETGRVPTNNRGHEYWLLDVMSDPRKSVRTGLSRKTYVLLHHLYEVGNYGQHQGGEHVSPGLAACVCLSAMELIACLTEDLGK